MGKIIPPQPIKCLDKSKSSSLFNYLPTLIPVNCTISFCGFFKNDLCIKKLKIGWERKKVETEMNWQRHDLLPNQWAKAITKKVKAAENIALVAQTWQKTAEWQKSFSLHTHVKGRFWYIIRVTIPHKLWRRVGKRKS